MDQHAMTELAIPPCCRAKLMGNRSAGSVPLRSQAAARPRGRVAGLISSLVSALGLLLAPKCPACLAMYLTAGTGTAVSISAAGHIKTALVLLCLAPLVSLAIRTPAAVRCL